MRQRSAFIDNLFSELMKDVKQSTRNKRLYYMNDAMSQSIWYHLDALNAVVCMTCETIQSNGEGEGMSDSPVDTCYTCHKDICDNCGGVEYCIACNVYFHSYCAKRHKQKCKRKKRKKWTENLSKGNSV